MKLELNVVNLLLYVLDLLNKEISTTGGEIMNLFFQNLFYKLSFGQRPRQYLNKAKKICNSH